MRLLAAIIIVLIIVIIGVYNFYQFMVWENSNYNRYSQDILTDNDYMAYHTVLPGWANDAFQRSNVELIRLQSRYLY